MECGICGQSVTEPVWTLWNVVSVGRVSQKRSGPYEMWYLWAECHRNGLDLMECGICGQSVTETVWTFWNVVSAGRFFIWQSAYVLS